LEKTTFLYQNAFEQNVFARSIFEQKLVKLTRIPDPRVEDAVGLLRPQLLLVVDAAGQHLLAGVDLMKPFRPKFTNKN
jgi:hypothetical protein